VPFPGHRTAFFWVITQVAVVTSYAASSVKKLPLLAA